MTALELYKYITDNNIEWDRHDNDGVEDVIIFPYFCQLDDFRKIAGPYLFDDDGISCTLKDGYLAIWMKDICDYYGFDFNEVFK